MFLPLLHLLQWLLFLLLKKNIIWYASDKQNSNESIGFWVSVHKLCHEFLFLPEVSNINSSLSSSACSVFSPSPAVVFGLFLFPGPLNLISELLPRSYIIKQIERMPKYFKSVQPCILTFTFIQNTYHQNYDGYQDNWNNYVYPVINISEY